MSRRRRRQEAQDLVRRARAALPPERIGMIMSVLLGNALVSVGLEIVLLVTAARTARRAIRRRGHGTRTVAQTAITRPLIVLTCVYGAHRFCSRRLLLRWVRRVVELAESDDRGDVTGLPTS